MSPASARASISGSSVDPGVAEHVAHALGPRHLQGSDLATGRPTAAEPGAAPARRTATAARAERVRTTGRTEPLSTWRISAADARNPRTVAGITTDDGARRSRRPTRPLAASTSERDDPADQEELGSSVAQQRRAVGSLVHEGDGRSADAGDRAHEPGGDAGAGQGARGSGAGASRAALAATASEHRARRTAATGRRSDTAASTHAGRRRRPTT